MNTPQFNWCETKLPNHPQPVPPIYQPEVAAAAVVWAAEHRRREVWVGKGAVQAIAGAKFAPGFIGDLYLGKTGYKAQQTSRPVDPDRPANLYEPVPDLHATHGNFGDQAKSRSPLLKLTEHRWLVAGAAAAGISGLVALALQRG